MVVVNLHYLTHCVMPLFNKPFRIIKKDQMVNTINNGDTIVEVEFEVGTKQYMIRRGIKPNLFEIYRK